MATTKKQTLQTKMLLLPLFFAVDRILMFVAGYIVKYPGNIPSVRRVSFQGQPRPFEKDKKGNGLSQYHCLKQMDIELEFFTKILRQNLPFSRTYDR
ncbi:hypothetical protein [Dethiosulfatarculus sandiegensis]|uniref:Uncharacterized protein n=1 Tax=Dethiosulfatarculus sandiegensis TaxID=1429043 RepID=A0A0D2J4E7_9BACT|nr:hypothetical protein [Dethiosulfatarculus sandiegensis]KIX12994.1 hypothetical protein X474_16230 [Dethiosulfatarculus sandiegensis]